jgi:glycerol-3-phosphate dehydrogenase
VLTSERQRHSVKLVGTHLDTDIIASCQKDRYHPTLKRTFPDAVEPYFLEQIDQALEGVETIVCGVNSLGIHWIASTLKPLLRPGQKIIAVTKGLEYCPEHGLRILPDVLLEGFGQANADRIPVAAIGGPCIAGELEGVTLEGAYVLQQLNRAIPNWEGKGMLSSAELPLLRWLCRIVTEDRPAGVPVDELRRAEQSLGGGDADGANV